MAWTAGADVLVGDLITAADWNNYMGAAGSINYVRDEACALWVPVTTNEEGGVEVVINVYGNYPVAHLTTANDTCNASFRVPDGFVGIATAVMVTIPRMTNGAANWDTYALFAAAGQAYNTHQTQDVATTYNVTNDEIFEVDYSPILAALAAGDYVGVQLLLGDNAHDVDVLGFYFAYTSV